MLTALHQIGQYFLLLNRVFKKPENLSLYWRQTLTEMVSLGLGSLGLIAIISFFMGAVVTLQTASNIDSPLIPDYAIGFATRQSFILELAPTMMCLILAGKIGSNIVSEIGTMRITEQIDAYEIMGVNSASYLILPKIVAALMIVPLIIIYSMFLGVLGGAVVSSYSDFSTMDKYLIGIRWKFTLFSIIYALIKTLFFAFIITSVPSFFGYYVRGGSLEIGKAATKSVVYSSIAILIINYILTELLLM
ncbi:MAG: ABC transporter permease [Flavobacteriales bacterium]|nr:ABC transporter permease [Flavobacteriales bacterium]